MDAYFVHAGHKLRKTERAIKVFIKLSETLTKALELL